MNEFLKTTPLNYLSFFKRILYDINFNKKHEIDEYVIFGARYGGKTFSYNWLIMMCLGANLSVTFYIFRYFKGDVSKSIFKEILSLLELLDWYDECEINLSRWTIKRGNVEILCDGIHGIRKEYDVKSAKGQKTQSFYNTKYAIIIFEECDEMSRDEIYNKTTAIRPRFNGQTIIINCGNPLHADNDFSLFVDKNLPYNFNYLLENTFQSKIITNHFQTKKGIIQYRQKFIRYTIEANPFAMENPNVRQNILKWKDINPKKYEAWYFGKPVIFTGDVFAQLIQYIGEVERSSFFGQDGNFYAGVDFGYTTNEFASLLLFKNKYDQVIVLAEFYLKPEGMYRNTSILIKEYFRWWEQISRDFPQIVADKLTVQADSENILYIQTLNQKAFQFKMTWLSFTECFKPKINQRISWMQTLFSDERVFILKNRIIYFINELELAEFDKNSSVEKLVKKNDHLIDSFCYALAREYQDLA